MLISWAHRVSGDYATSANWSPAVVPGPSDDVSISVNGTYTVTSSVDEAVNSLSLLDKHATLLIEGTSPHRIYDLYDPDRRRQRRHHRSE